MKLIHRIFFAVALAVQAISDRLRGRALAVNVLLTPHETKRGTQSMDADAGVVTTSFNAVVKIGSDDRHFALPGAADMGGDPGSNDPTKDRADKLTASILGQVVRSDRKDL